MNTPCQVDLCSSPSSGVPIVASLPREFCCSFTICHGLTVSSRVPFPFYVSLHPVLQDSSQAEPSLTRLCACSIFDTQELLNNCLLNERYTSVDTFWVISFKCILYFLPLFAQALSSAQNIYPYTPPIPCKSLTLVL